MSSRKRLAIAALLVLAAPSFAASKFEPPPGKTLLFVGQDVDSIRTYLHDLKTVPAGFMTYTSLENLEGLTTEYDDGGGKMNAQSLVDEHPNTALQIGLYLVDQLENTSSGHYDDRIDKLGAWIQSTKRPVFLRVGYEFDNPGNRYAPAGYVAAFRHIVERLRKDGVTNVAFVWHSFAQGNPDRMKDWYPGDEYVDWVGASHFGQFPKWIRQVVDLADQLKKPFMLAETSSWYIRNDAQRLIYFKRLFELIENRHVAALCYINTNWDAQSMWETQHYGDGRVQPYADVLKLWKDETAKKMYLKSSPGLFKEIDFR